MASREESEYDSGIKRRLYDYSSYDSLTGSLCGRQLKRGREREDNEKEKEQEDGDEEKDDKVRQARWFCYLKLRAECTHLLSFVTCIRNAGRFTVSLLFLFTSIDFNASSPSASFAGLEFASILPQMDTFGHLFVIKSRRN